MSNEIINEINRTGGMLPRRPIGTFEDEMATKVMRLNVRIAELTGELEARKVENARLRAALERIMRWAASALGDLPDDDLHSSGPVQSDQTASAELNGKPE